MEQVWAAGCCHTTYSVKPRPSEFIVQMEPISNCKDPDETPMQYTCSNMKQLLIQNEVDEIIDFVQENLTDSNHELRHEFSNGELSEIFTYHDLAHSFQ